MATTKTKTSPAAHAEEVTGGAVEAPPEEKTQEVTVADRRDIAPAREMTMEEMLAADAGHGSEFIGLKERQIPFLYTLQNGSPQVAKGGPAYVKGAESSMIINTLTSDVYPANIAERDKGCGILVIPVHFKTKAIEWVKRSEGGGGGGLVRVWGDDEGYKTNEAYVFDPKRNRYGNPASNSEVADHYDTYLLQIGRFGPETPEEPGGELILIEPMQAVLSCKGMQIKKARAWNAERIQRRMTVAGRSLPAPAWYDAWRIQTRYEQNDQGNWFGWVISRYKPTVELPGGTDFYMAARAMYQDVQTGLLRTDEAALGNLEPAAAHIDEEVPF